MTKLPLLMVLVGLVVAGAAQRRLHMVLGALVAIVGAYAYAASLH